MPTSAPESQLEYPTVGWMYRVIRCFAVYALTSAPIFLAGALAPDFITPVDHRLAAPGDLPYTVWDGKWYAKIATRGYEYDPTRQSSVAFFPLFPLLGAGLARATGMPVDAALFLIANLAFFAALVLIDLYVHVCEPNPPPRKALFVLLAVALFPTSFFFRFPYTESLFLLLAVAVLLGMNRRWPLWLLAALIGLATAARPVGVALLLPFADQCLISLRERPPFRGAKGDTLRLAPLLALACWGLLAYMLYLHLTFGDPLAFLQAQSLWLERPAVPLADRLIDLLALEPVWSVYVPSCECYWQKHADPGQWFNLQFANPILFIAVVAAVVVGARRGLLSRAELLLAVPILAIPYLTRGHEMCMDAFGRFAIVCLPAFLILGHALARLPSWLAATLLAASALLSAAFAAKSTAGFLFF